MSFDELFKQLVWDALVRAALRKLFAALPWLSWGPLGAVTSYVFIYFADRLYEVLSEVIEMEYIAFKNEAHRRTFDKSVVSLQAIADGLGVDSPEFKEQREKALADLSKFVRFN